MRFDQTTESLDDRANSAGCAFLSGLLLSEEAGYPEWINTGEANAAFQYLIDSGIIRNDGFILKWDKFGDWLFKPGEMVFHREGPSYALKPGDFAEAYYVRVDEKNVVHGHFIAAYPTEIDPFPKSLTRRVGILDSYRVWTREAQDEKV